MLHQPAVAFGRYLARCRTAVHAALVASAARRVEEILRDRDFRLGGKYDLANPSKWENGGEGGVTLESLGGRQAAHRLHRDRHAAAQRGGRDHQCGRHQLLLFRRFHRHVRAVGQGRRALRRHADHRSGPSDRHRSLLCRDGRSARHLGRQQTVRRAGDQVSAIQLLRHGAGELSHAARPSEGREGGAGRRRLDGRHPDLCLGRDAPAICRRDHADWRHDAIGCR